MQTTSIKICLVIMALVLSDISAINQCGSEFHTYYVAPNGSDTNPGTYALPWKTMHKAASELQAGDTAIFEDGIYYETRPTEIAYDGRENAPITLRSRNKHRSIIIYQGLSETWGKLHITKKYITVQDFEITQDNIGTTTNDVMVFCHEGADNCRIIGNKIHKAYEECIKSYMSDHILIHDNICYNTIHEGIDISRSLDATISNNEIFEVGRTAIMTKAGIRTVLVVNNYIHAANNLIEGIILGDQTSADAAYDISGYEAYNAVAWNNVIIADPTGTVSRGLVMYGCNECAFLNNVVVGSDTAISITRAEDKKYGWTWDPLTKNPSFRNNIVIDCKVSASNFEYQYIQGILSNDYNLYYRCPNAPSENHSIYADPMLVNKYSDWRLQRQSPAINAGITNTFHGFQGDPIDVSRDRESNRRGEAWDIGAYESDTASHWLVWLSLIISNSPC